MAKIRLDNLILARELADSLEKARAMIMSGTVLVQDQKMDKSGYLVDETASIRLLKPPTKYVSRGGEKLAGAYQHFGIPIENRVALDVGISTGGFTDFLLQNQAKFVFGVDVSYGLLAYSIRQNPKVAILERTNARTLSKAQLAQAVSTTADFVQYIDKIDLVVMDASFISVTKILPAIKTFVLPQSDYIILIKPQFEAQKDQIGSGGIIRDAKTHQAILASVRAELNCIEFQIIQECESPIHGTKGNTEFFFWLKSVSHDKN